MGSLWSYFTDPVLQAPTLASMLMCLSSALIGVVVVLRRRSLLGEALSHATYPGVVISVLFSSFFSEGMALLILLGAFLSSCVGLFVINRLERSYKVKADAALSFVIALFFGVGVLIASRIQFTHALWYKAVQIFLYGQVATMVGVHVVIYGIFALLIIGVLCACFHPIRMGIFDRDFSKSIGLPLGWVEVLLSLLLSLAIVIGIRSVGVVLMAGMLIAPAIGARQFSHSLSSVFVIAACMGAVSGFLGNYFSMQIPLWTAPEHPFSLPTGPMILLCSTALCLASLLFAPERGLLSRFFRILRFRRQCREENALKYLWRQKKNPQERGGVLPTYFLLRRLKRQGWVEILPDKTPRLSKDGMLRATKIVRFHRLWEAYLVFLGQGIEKVHRSAEEMEHIITPELEQKLTDLLGDPRKDPHEQPIPPKEETL